MPFKFNPFTGTLDKVANLDEAITHSQLSDMPDTAGSNTDHDERYPERSEWGQNGIEDRSLSTLTWTDTGPNRTLSIQPTGASFNYYIDGEKYTTTGDTVQITDVEGIHIIYYDGSTLTSQANPTVGQTDVCIRNKALVSIVYWDATNSTVNYVGEERHGAVMSPQTHSYLHFINGLAYLTGIGLNTITVNQNGDVNSHAQFGVDAGDVSDEDIYLTTSAINSTSGLPIYYLDGASANIRKTTEAGFSVTTTGTGRLAWNEYTGGAWQLSEVDNNDFVLCHVFATTEKDNPIVAFMGQAEYNTIGQARTGALTEIQNLTLNNILFPEFRAIATVIFQTSNSYSNDVKGRIRSTNEGDDYIDWRNEVISRVEVSTSDHGALSGLGDDDHTQYFLIEGRSTDINDLTSSDNAGTETNILCDATAGGITVTLPAIADNTGKVYNIKKIDSSANTVTVDGNAAETIDGATTQIISYQYNSMSLVGGTSEWHLT